MTNGFGAMQDYRAQVDVDGSLGDRRLHPRPAIEPARDRRRRARGQAAGARRAAVVAERHRTRRRRSTERHVGRTFRSAGREHGCRRTFRSVGGARPRPQVRLGGAEAPPQVRLGRGCSPALQETWQIRLTRSRPASAVSSAWRSSSASSASGLCAVGFLGDREHFFRAWLMAYMVWFGVALGSMAWLMIQYLSGGAWGVVTRRIFEASSRTLPFMAVLFLPIAFGVHDLYLWSHPDVVATDEILQHRDAVHEPVVLLRARGHLLRVVVGCWRTSCRRGRGSRTPRQTIGWRFGCSG